MDFKKSILIKKEPSLLFEQHTFDDFWPAMGCINPLNHMLRVLWVTFQIEIKSETKQRLQEDDWLFTLSFHVAYRKVFHDKIHLLILRCCLNDHFLLLHRTKHTCVKFCTGMTCIDIFSPSVAKGWCYVIVVNWVLGLTKTRRKKQHLQVNRAISKIVFIIVSTSAHRFCAMALAPFFFLF